MRAKAGKSSRENCSAKLPNERLIVGDVVERNEDWSEHFTGDEEMPQAGPGVAATGGAGAVGIERSEIFLVDGITQSHRSTAGEGHRVATVASRHDAIEHVDAPTDGLKNVLGSPHSHQVSRLVFREQRDGAIKSSIHEWWRFTDA